MSQLLWSPLQITLSELSEADRRLSVVENAKMFNNLGACATPESYANAIGCDLENQAYRDSYVPKYPTKDWNASSCALTVRSLIRHLGCNHESIKSPYVAGTAMQNLFALGTITKSFGAKDSLPFLGSLLYLTDLSPGSQHIEVAVEMPSEDTVKCIAGGQVFDGSLGDPCTYGGGTDILTVTRKFSWEGDKLYVTSIPRNKNKPPSKRMVLWWIDSAKLPWTEKVRTAVLF